VSAAQRALWGMTQAMRDGLLLLLAAGPEGLGPNSGLAHVTAAALALRGCVKLSVGPIDDARRWTASLLPDGMKLARCLVRAKARKLAAPDSE
jgi:hypothetical protein